MLPLIQPSVSRLSVIKAVKDASSHRLPCCEDLQTSWWRSHTVSSAPHDWNTQFTLITHCSYHNWIIDNYYSSLNRTWGLSGSSGGSGVPAAPLSSRTSWSWRSGSGSPPRPPSDAGNAACRRSASWRSVRSTRWTRRCSHHRRSTCLEIHTAAAWASAAGQREEQTIT